MNDIKHKLQHSVLARQRTFLSTWAVDKLCLLHTIAEHICLASGPEARVYPSCYADQA
jgi:hypothetical protein